MAAFTVSRVPHSGPSGPGAMRRNWKPRCLAASSSRIPITTSGLSATTAGLLLRGTGLGAMLGRRCLRVFPPLLGQRRVSGLASLGEAHPAQTPEIVTIGQGDQSGPDEPVEYPGQVPGCREAVIEVVTSGSPDTTVVDPP